MLDSWCDSCGRAGEPRITSCGSERTSKFKFRSDNVKVDVLLFVVAVAVAAFGQGKQGSCDPGWHELPSGRCERDADPKEQPAVKTATESAIHLPTISESPEHAYYRQQFEAAQQVYNDTAAKKTDLDGQIDALGRKRGGHGSPEMILLMRTRLAILDRMANYLDVVERRKHQLDNADNCTALFRTTVDKKTSDLTVRESESVKGCQSLDLYPPKK